MDETIVACPEKEKVGHINILNLGKKNIGFELHLKF